MKMTGTKSVHQCLFCPQIFDSAAEKDDHILEHFPQEICTDCDQNLIRIGSNLYTLHNAVTCIRRESKPVASILDQSHIGTINQDHDESDGNVTFSSAHQVCDQEMCIKAEPEEQNEKFPCVGTITIHQIINIDSGESFANQKNNENVSVHGAVPMNTVSAQQMEIKVEAEALVEQPIHADVNNFTEPNYIDQSSNDVYQSDPGTITLSHKQPKQRHKYERIACKICAKLFSAHWMNKHMRAFHTTKEDEIVFDEYQCDICKRFIRKKLSLISHMKRKHVRKHKKCKKFKCQHCSRIFSNKQCLEYHQVRNICRSQLNNSKRNRMTSADKCYVCEICGAKYTHPNAVKTHQYRKHNIGHPCVRCKHVFHSAHGLINHGLECEKRSQRSFECFLCHRVCPSKNALACHLRNKHVSSEKKKFICEVCNRCFSCLPALQSHKTRIHMNLDIRNFVCTTCGRAFRNKFGLEQHERIHTGERPFECSYDGCSKTFRTRSGIYAHLKIHRGEKQFRCRINGCTEEFGGPAGYKKHRWTAHGIPILKK